MAIFVMVHCIADCFQFQVKQVHTMLIVIYKDLQTMAISSMFHCNAGGFQFRVEVVNTEWIFKYMFKYLLFSWNSQYSVWQIE